MFEETPEMRMMRESMDEISSKYGDQKVDARMVINEIVQAYKRKNRLREKMVRDIAELTRG